MFTQAQRVVTNEFQQLTHRDEAMENERMILAIGRVERALSRIEAAKEKQSGAPDDALEERHSALKQEMQQAIETIDGLIAKQEH